MAKTLRPTVAPNLPVGPVDYEQNYQNQLNSIQRLYYNTIDNTLTVLLEDNGGRFLNFPHIAAQYNGTQYLAGDNTPTLVKWDTLDTSSGFTLNTVSGYSIPTYDGVYKIDYSLQLANNDTVNEHDVVVWLRIDGHDLAGSASKFSLAKAKGSSSYSYVVAYSSVCFKIYAGQTIELMWGADKAATSGGIKGIYMYYEAAQTTPMAYPFIPSAIGSITFVSELSQ